MEFSFVQFYLTPGKNFNSSYRLQQYISKEVSAKILAGAETRGAGDWEIYFWVTTSLMKQDYTLKLESVGKKNKRKTFVFNFSYQKVRDSKEPIEKFIQLLFHAIASLNGDEFQVDV